MAGVEAADEDEMERNAALGMSLRDWFAGQAMVAIASRWGGMVGDIDGDAMDRSAILAYGLADAMLRARGVPIG